MAIDLHWPPHFELWGPTLSRRIYVTVTRRVRCTAAAKTKIRVMGVAYVFHVGRKLWIVIAVFTKSLCRRHRRHSSVSFCLMIRILEVSYTRVIFRLGLIVKQLLSSEWRQKIKDNATLQSVTVDKSMPDNDKQSVTGWDGDLWWSTQDNARRLSACVDSVFDPRKKHNKHNNSFSLCMGDDACRCSQK